MKQQLTKEQSRRLIELGVPTEKASASIAEETQGDGCSWTYPVFTIGDLLEVLSKEIYVEKSLCGSEKSLTIIIENELAVATYSYYDGEDTYSDCAKICKKELIDALFDLAVWCIENGYIKTEKL